MIFSQSEFYLIGQHLALNVASSVNIPSVTDKPLFKLIQGSVAS